MNIDRWKNAYIHFLLKNMKGVCGVFEVKFFYISFSKNIHHAYYMYSIVPTIYEQK